MLRRQESPTYLHLTGMTMNAVTLTISTHRHLWDLHYDQRKADTEKTRAEG